MQREASAQDGGSEERGAAIGLVSSRECKPAKSINKLEFDGAISQARRQLEQRIVKLTSEESPKGRVQMETGEQSTGTANACAASDTTEKLGE